MPKFKFKNSPKFKKNTILTLKQNDEVKRPYMIHLVGGVRKLKGYLVSPIYNPLIEVNMGSLVKGKELNKYRKATDKDIITFMDEVLKSSLKNEGVRN